MKDWTTGLYVNWKGVWPSRNCNRLAYVVSGQAGMYVAGKPWILSLAVSAYKGEFCTQGNAARSSNRAATGSSTINGSGVPGWALATKGSSATKARFRRMNDMGSKAICNTLNQRLCYVHSMVWV